jgi:NAD+ synthase
MALKLSRTELQYSRDKITDFISAYLSDSGLDGALVALSGGVDSALVAKLAHEALGDKLYALILPEEGVSDPRDLEDARRLAERLGIGYEIIRINPALEGIRRCYPRIAHDKENEKIAWANVKPRVRMIINYITANLSGRLVLGTGNKTELLLGYFTKYGDGGVDILPIGDLYKTQVRQLAGYVGIDKAIVDKTPSAGLWAGQTDEGELGASYETMDKVLYNLISEKKSIEETAKASDVSRDLVRKISARVKQNEHKGSAPTILRLFD